MAQAAGAAHAVGGDTPEGKGGTTEDPEYTEKATYWMQAAFCEATAGMPPQGGRSRPAAIGIENAGCCLRQKPAYGTAAAFGDVRAASRDAAKPGREKAGTPKTPKSTEAHGKGAILAAGS